MAGTRKSPRSRAAAADLPALVRSALQRHVPPGSRVAVGLSGGIDSVVLLDVLSRLAPRAGIVLSAVHVNHQLSPHAAGWSRFCRTLCAGLGVPLRVARVNVARRASREDAAREARYRAYGRTPADFIALAHHGDDQAETLLLQLLRGAGVRGLAGMPEARTLAAARGGSRTLLRPLLAAGRRDIEAYARSRGLDWIEDESNRDVAHGRNFLRHEVLPLLETRYPAARRALARSAGHLGEAASLLDGLAARDAAGAGRDGTLEVAALGKLPAARARGVLREFIARAGERAPPARRLEEILRQVLEARSDARVCVALGGADLRRHAGTLHVVPRRQAAPPTCEVPWRGERDLRLAELGGVLRMTPARGQGISLAKLGAGPVRVRLRRGGERLQPEAGRPRRTLKYLWQEQGVPVWLRSSRPHIYCGESLVGVPGLGIDCAFQARPGEPGVIPEWIAR